LLHDEYINFLKRVNKTYDGEFPNYYITRQLKRFIQIDRIKLNEELEKKKEEFVIVFSDEAFNQKCQEQSNEKSIHYLKYEHQQLIWQKSKGRVSDLNDFIINKEEFCSSINEQDIRNENEKILIISSEPGMGKSSILDSLAHLSNSSHFFLKIVLNSFTKVLYKLQKKTIDFKETDALNFILQESQIIRSCKKSTRKSDHQLENKLLKHLAEKEKLILMFDGVDEVVDFKEQVKILIKSLNEKSKLKKILITTRNHLRTELEDHTKTISYNLNNFDTKDQINFLVKYCRQTKQTIDGTKAEELITKMKSSLTGNIVQLIGIPLQTKMIAEIYLNKLNFDDIKINNIAELYHEFVETKFKIKFEEKNAIEIESNLELYERENELFYDEHIRFSAQILLHRTKKDPLVKGKIKDLIKYGLIVDMRNEIPIFLHQSYSEYFVAKMALNKIDQNREVDDDDISKILINKEFFLVRKFLNDLMDKEQRPKQQNKCVKYEEPITNCCNENLPKILIYLIAIRNADIKSKNEFLVLSSENGHKEIVQLLIEKGIDINQTDEDGRNALHWASANGHKEIVQLLIEKGIDINQTDEDGENALHLATSNGHKEIVQLIIEKGIDINQTDGDGENALHLASENGNKEIVQLLIEKGIDINQTSEYGRNALHWASANGHKEIVQLLIEKGIDINQTSEYGRNALHWASANGHKEIVQLLIEKGIVINQEGGDGENALHMASENGHKEIVQLLIEKGMDINKTDKRGRNALHLASSNGHK
jgi:ankyrin repeat protein